MARQHIALHPLLVRRTVNKISLEYITWPNSQKLVWMKFAGPGGNKLLGCGGEKKWVLFCALAKQAVRGNKCRACT